MFIRRVLLATTVLVSLVGCASTPAPKSVADTLAQDPNLSTLNSLVVKVGLVDTLKAAGPFTVFAPSNDAFKAVPAKTMEALGKDSALLKDVLLYHVLSGKVMAADVKAGKAKTVNGSDVTFSKAGSFVTVEDAVVQTADRAATNGVVHIIDAVLIPPKK
jgi:uncharacterized surface protein with fasciclin (FAS1) repeats